ncbi:MAG TPA: putative metal-binding motif-containing protein [Methylomirabilota bacterium]|nr:putative metal-binding motif-containing protein [Methylomirabilota bacterium]
MEADAQQSFINVPLLLPVVPAGFTGALQVVVTLPVNAVESTFFANLGSPYFHPALDTQVVSGFVQGAQAYAAQGLGVAISPALGPDLERYVTNQLQLVVSNGRNDLVTNLGATPQVYSIAQLQADAAIFGAVRTLANSQASAAPPAAPTWLATAYHVLVSFLSWLEPTEAQALTPGRGGDCSGQVLPERASCGADGIVYLPPPIQPPPGCDPNEVKERLKDASGTLSFLLSPPDCRITSEQCAALKDLGYTEIHFSDGSSICAETNCGKTYTTPSGKTVTTKCKVLPVNPKKAIDPNAKAGSLGVSTAQFLVDKSPLSYTIHFENLETATAPAQIVTITDPLALQNLDLDTLSLGPITLGHLTLLPAPGLSQFAGGIDLRPAQNLIVTVSASLDKSTGVLTWLFSSMNPDTGQVTDDPDAGFLPPNVNPPEGEGSVVFTVQPKAGLATGTAICNQASIVFDANAPIPTPQWCNSIDSTPPSSQVLSLAANQTSTSFTVNWTGTDTGSDVADYTIFVSENGGPFSPFLSNTTDTSATFTGQVGHSDAFYSIARDLASNEEAPPSAPDAQTLVGGLDQCPDDPNKTDPGACGCGVPDTMAGQACTTGQPGVCSAGIIVCSAGSSRCQRNVQPSAEVCDALDNNCDGAVDEGNPGGGAACSTGRPGVCSAGILVCTNGALVCQQTTQPGAEICVDGLDNDCDGIVDNGCPPPPPIDACLPTTILDTFNRADGGVGPNWRGATTPTFYRIASNRLDVQAGGPLYWNPIAFGTSQAAFVTLSTIDSKGPSQGLLLKVQSGSVPEAGAIAVVYDAVAKAVRVSTLRLGALTWTSYGNTAVVLSNGDKLGACAKANGEVRVYKNDTLVKTVTLNAADQGFFNGKGGKVGLWSLLAPQAFLDDFGGATIAP